MKRSKYCAKHKQRHSVHSQMHCEQNLKPGKCLDKTGQPRQARCPIVQTKYHTDALGTP